MKFITEEDLRDLYRKEPFTDYEIEPGTRITPGARQFLTDRGINMLDHNNSCETIKNTENRKHTSEPLEKRKDLAHKRLYNKMKSMETLFLITAEEFLSRDILLAQKMIHINKSFSDIKNILDGRNSSDNHCCQKCTGIDESNFSDNLEDCFEITEFHIQLGKGKEIILLHRLRCALRETELDMLEFLDSNDDENNRYEEVVEKMNQIINTLSQLICSTAGGEKCQKKC
ncbi:MAG: ethanolamine utilization protein [Clostridia bacterium]|nr:ethanolamine utilization protein [Clostridia bacterium]